MKNLVQFPCGKELMLFVLVDHPYPPTMVPSCPFPDVLYTGSSSLGIAILGTMEPFTA